MTEDEVRELVTALPHVAVQIAGEADGAPEVAWGDSFFFYEPAGKGSRRDPFATLVTKDYPGFDTASDLNRPGIFRVNVGVGREAFRELFGYLPEAHPEHHAEFDYTALDQLLPHPVYAPQGWVSVLNPGPQTVGQLEVLLRQAHDRAAQRYERREAHGQPH
jgi:hypothetical protein